MRAEALRVAGRDVLGLPAAGLRELRGRLAAMVFQDPLTSLNPVLTVGAQMVDVQHRDRASRAEKLRLAAEKLRRVGIADPEHRLAGYPHELSGGMRQRVAIAMALLVRPELLVADEPTTALDVTTQAQIVRLLRELRGELAGGVLFVSHDLGLVAQLCDRVVILYAGEVAEEGTTRELFADPRHPYTRLLLECDPARVEEATRRLPTIPGEVPSLVEPPPGCVFHPRCPRARGPLPARGAGLAPALGHASGALPLRGGAGVSAFLYRSWPGLTGPSGGGERRSSSLLPDPPLKAGGDIWPDSA